MRYRMLFFFLFSVVGYARAQLEIIGQVADSVSGRPLARASVTAVLAGCPVAFVRTDADGRFSMKVRAADSLAVSFLGYARRVLPVSSGKTYDIRIAPSAFVLKEVQVGGTRAFARQDTVFFDLKRFADVRDNSLKDVLKKLPGVDVDRSGAISYNGKAINRFTVEDLDLTGGRYNRLTEAVKAGDVDRLEVMEHDQPVKALQGKVFTDDVAMNIKLKPEARDKLMFTLKPTVATAFPLNTAEPCGAADVLQIGRKRQRMYAAEYDCTGRDLSVSDMALATGGIVSYSSGTSVPQWFDVPSASYPIDGERLRFNRSFDLSVKDTRKNAGGGERRITAGCIHTTEEQSADNTSVYYFDAANPQTTLRNDASVIRNDRIYVDVSQQTNTSKAYGSEHFLVEATRTDASSCLDSYGDETVNQRMKIPELHVSNLFRRIVSGNRHSLSFLSDVDFHHAPMSIAVDGTETMLKNTLFRADNKVRLIRQRRFVTYDYTVGAVVEHLDVEGGNTHLALLASPSCKYERLNLSVRLNLPMEWDIFFRRDRQFLNFSPSLMFNMKTGSRGEWIVGTGYSRKTGGWTDFALGEYDSDYRTHVITHGTIPCTGTFYANAGYNYKRPVREFFSSFSASYNYFHGNVMTDMTITDGKYLLDIVARDNHGQTVSSGVFVSKGFFDLHLKTRLELKYAYAEGFRLSGVTKTGYVSNILTVSPEVSFSPSFGTFTYSGSFVRTDMKVGGTGRNRLFCHTQRLSYTQSAGPVDFTFSAVCYHNELQSAASVNTLLADAGAVWRMKKVRLHVRIRNLFDKRSYTVTSYSDVVSSTNMYYLRPRELVADIQVGI